MIGSTLPNDSNGVVGQQIPSHQSDYFAFLGLHFIAEEQGSLSALMPYFSKSDSHINQIKKNPFRQAPL